MILGITEHVQTDLCTRPFLFLLKGPGDEAIGLACCVVQAY